MVLLHIAKMLSLPCPHCEGVKNAGKRYKQTESKLQQADSGGKLNMQALQFTTPTAFLLLPHATALFPVGMVCKHPSYRLVVGSWHNRMNESMCE